MIEGKTTNGFAFSIPDDAIDNMELVDALADADESGSPLAISRVLLLMIGREQRKKLYDHLRAEDGRVPVEAVGTAMKDMLSAMGTMGKNSEPSPA